MSWLFCRNTILFDVLSLIIIDSVIFKQGGNSLRVIFTPNFSLDLLRLRLLLIRIKNFPLVVNFLEQAFEIHIFVAIAAVLVKHDPQNIYYNQSLKGAIKAKDRSKWILLLKYHFFFFFLPIFLGKNGFESKSLPAV